MGKIDRNYINMYKFAEKNMNLNLYYTIDN